MDSGYDLSYDEKDTDTMGGVYYKYIRDYSGEIFGTVVANQFYYSHNDSMEDLLFGMFGHLSYQLMLEYLNKKFPSLKIKGLG